MGLEASQDPPWLEVDVLALALSLYGWPEGLALMRINVSLTLCDWWPHWFEMQDYLAIGIGPIFIEFDWGAGRPLWEK